MSGVATAVIGTQVVGGYLAREAGDEAAGRASSAQQGAANKGIAQIKELLMPYAEAGIDATGAQADILGLSGAGKQQQAIGALESSPIFQALLKSGETGILQNASATGGLRGGGVQEALAQFRPQMLNQLIEQQFSRLGTVANRGQSAGTSAGMSIADLLGQIGQAQAGQALAEGQNQANFIGGITSALGGL